MKPLAHSYSSFKMYENCPQRYYRQRIKKDVVDTGSPASDEGERIHKLLEKRLAEAQELPSDVAKYEALCRSFEKLGAKGELHVEKELVLNADLEPTGWWSKDAWLRSKLDVLVLAGSTAIVADWKTGKRRPDMFQMEIFAAQVFKHFTQVDTVKAMLVWLKDMATDTEVYHRKHDYQGVMGGIVTAASRIENSLKKDVWPAKPSGLCGWCPARETCQWAGR